MILAFSLGERVVNHLARRCEVSTCAVKEMVCVILTTLPCRDSRIMYLAAPSHQCLCLCRLQCGAAAARMSRSGGGVHVPDGHDGSPLGGL